ncbi:hypothetical protein [Bremerella sp. P1]|uniref:hypothetical protein n=1 Tax=Bremerella sp. P1 TaxID=3026424 RepID=UPI002367B82D|nr:hypothetical protein [Bremerella sp. P1]WDI43373.1 hypothetical protein PSR63_05365 [Bremerella sp. P1]
MTDKLKTKWIAVEPELFLADISTEAKKLAVYIRDNCGLYDPWDPEMEIFIPFKLNRKADKICADLGFSREQLELAVKDLRRFPTKSKRFLEGCNAKRDAYLCSPLRSGYIKVYRWLLESPLPWKVKEAVFVAKAGGQIKNAKVLEAVTRLGLIQEDGTVTDEGATFACLKFIAKLENTKA